MSRTRNAAVLVAAVALLALAGCGSGQKQQTADNPGGAVIRTASADPNGLRGAVLDRPYALPAKSLTDTSGNEFNLRTSTKKPVTLVFFGYTNCPDVCSTVMADVASALTKLDDPVRNDVQMLFVTTDPARDTGPVIRKYLDRFDPSFVGLTGSLASIKDIAKAVGVPVEGMKKLPSGGYEVGHGAQVLGFGKDEKATVLWLSNAAIGDMAHDFGKLVEDNR
ncbi:electron transport protein SCO1/SenC [Kribbella sp. ALI-6-A]|uniref:SCO family protein n=1 Tax=Kribbella sp. ALI-6-A TaxID=1933817 RepID=UPI00097BE852|nr:SCO family protein [Kribbella sp. ALI-6-A]ONI69554.1 electron transport protein SCO1/SenC [Kribbella sp. ALI-6-A]